MVLQIDEITRLYEIHGMARYGNEAVSQQQHALQCAHLAQRAGASSELVTAALLHDLGHLLAASTENEPGSIDDGHQYAAIPFLRGLFPDAVLEPIRMHMEAKRYLCAMDSAYWAKLSAASRLGLKLQGGPLLASEAARFIQRPFAQDAIAVRRWDALARDPHANPPAWSHFLPVLRRAALREIELAA